MIDPIDAAMGAAIRKRREAKGLSQTALAEACGITFQQVQKYEKGTNRVSVSRLVQIASKLETTPGDLFQDIGPESEKHARALANMNEVLDARQANHRRVFASARRVSRAMFNGASNWSFAMELYGLGSNYAYAMCERIGVDPERSVVD